MTVLDQRIIPFQRFGTLRAHRVWERNYLSAKRGWKVVISGFFEPVFYLLSIGFGLQRFIGDLPGPGGEPVSYTAFVAPGLLAAAAMNGAIFETTFNIFFKLKYGKVYDGILTTPLEPRDVALGEIGWSMSRGGLYTVGFLIVMLVLGLIESWWGLLALPASILIGLAFGGAGMAATTFMKSWQDFDLVNLVTLPLFLFSATFYPLDFYPDAIQPLIQLSPLYQGAALLRGLTLGVIDWSMLGHVAFLVTMATIGLAISIRRLRTLLMK